MKNYFLFFRLWPGFSEPFPFDRFDGIAKTDELVQALNSWARDEIRRPEVRRAIMQVARCRKKQLLAATKKRSGTYASRPASSPGGRSCRNISRRSLGTRQLTERDLYWPRIRQPERPEPLICRFGSDRGWWREEGNDPIPFGPPVWFYQVSSSELAETVVSFLNTQTNLDLVDDNGMEFGFQPRFGFVEDEDITLRISARLCINSIAQGKVPEVRSGGAALLMGQKALALVDDILEAAMPPTPASPQENSCVISREETVNPDQEALATEVEENGYEKQASHLKRLADVNSLKKPFTAIDEAKVIRSIREYLEAFEKEVSGDGTPGNGELDNSIYHREKPTSLENTDTHTKPSDNKQPESETVGDAKGVSLQNVAVLLRPDNPARQKQLVTTWRNSKSPKLPSHIGKDPDHKQRNLYNVEQLIDFLAKYEKGAEDDYNLRENLNRLKRSIAIL